MPGASQRTIGPIMRELRGPEDLSLEAEKMRAIQRITGSQYLRKERVTESGLKL